VTTNIASKQVHPESGSTFDQKVLPFKNVQVKKEEKTKTPMSWYGAAMVNNPV